MKNNIIRMTLALFVTGTILSCHEHEDFHPPQIEEVKVEFDSTHLIIRENEDTHIIRLSFGKRAPVNGVLTFSFSNSLQSRFTTEPALSNGQLILNVEQNQEFVVIKIKPINNPLHDGSIEFSISILEATSGFSIGDEKSVSVTILDDDSPTPSKEIVANFTQTENYVAENSSDGKPYLVKLSEPLSTPGTIEISMESARAFYGTQFNTIPAVINDKITLSPVIGEAAASFTIIPIDNAIITGEIEITFTITNTTGSIVMGNRVSQKVSIADDELTNKPKSFASSGGLWGLKKTYEYEELGRIKYVHIERSSPATSTHTEAYFYGTDGQIERITAYPQIDIVFTWANNKIRRSEKVDNGIIKEYTDYDYDSEGNVTGAANYYKQPDGQFKLGFLNLFFYFQDGNLFKSQTYIPIEGSEEYALISTKTYDEYLDAANPFPMVEILPTVKTQKNLPSLYTVEENGMTLRYGFVYEFREDGLVNKRIVVGATAHETSQYLYY